MLYDYILDIFGKFRKRKTRFTDLEKRTLELIRAFVEKSISDKDFAQAFDIVRTEFLKLIKDNGQLTIDEDTPLWLNIFIGLHYIDWRKYQQLKNYFEEHPEELVGETKENFERIQGRGYDERFLEACMTVLKEVKI